MEVAHGSYLAALQADSPQPYRHIQEKIQIKKMILKISDFFFPLKGAMIQTTDLLIPLGCKSDHSGLSLVGSCDLIKILP